MEHIEIHVMKSPRDVELAHIAGLIDLSEKLDDTQYLSTICNLCETHVRYTHDTETSAIGLVLVSDVQSIVSCETCLGLALHAVCVVA
jgi:hypothetical protein